MTRDQRRAIVSGLVASGALAVLIFVGSRNLRHVDAALVGYTFACIFAAFSVAYRYSMWLQRPPTRQYWRRGWQAFLQRGHRWESMKKFAVPLCRRLSDESVHLEAKPQPCGSPHADHVGLHPRRR